MKTYSDVTNLHDLLNVTDKINAIKEKDPEILELLPDLEDWLIAGRITAYLLSYGKSLITNDAGLYDIYDKIDTRFNEICALTDKEITYAFPINISLDDCAAHNTPEIDDETILSHNIVKLDIGVCVNGCIGDSALTVDLSETHESLVQASKEALMNAIPLMLPGKTVSEVGTEIERTILSYSFSPIRNLSGHRITHFTLHSGKNIPNFNSKEETLIEYGDIFAVEPFATDGAGLIENSGQPEIFRLIELKNTRSAFTRQVLQAIRSLKTLPFSKLQVARLGNSNSPAKINFALREMRSLNMIDEYAQLIEVDNGLVSQREHTVIVGNEPIITTTLD